MAVMNINNQITLAIPAYARPYEFEILLESVASCCKLPNEILVCEDFSPDRQALRQIAERFRSRFEEAGCRFTYIENAENLGYDGNIRKLLASAAGDWVMLIGNDDAVLPDAFSLLNDYLLADPDVTMISRAFLRFDIDPDKPLGLSRMSDIDRVYSAKNSPPRCLFRATGFVGGLVINAAWARQLATSQYDGTLYYQVYLAAHAFCQNGIGYIAKPTVAARAGNPPLFGSAAKEKGIHQAGRYSPKARAHMWASVMRICDDVGKEYSVDLLTDIQGDLRARMSFHVFEMMANAPGELIDELCLELRKIGLYPHPVPVTLRGIIRLLGPRSRYFFQLVRKVMQ